MIPYLKKAWNGYFLPLVQRPKALQVGALCHRTKAGETQILLITSRDTGRWIIPKGWPIRGLESAEAALKEAWEEAGVKHAELGDAPIGSYVYDKVLDSGLAQPVEILTYPVAVQELAVDYPEADERRRKWVSPEEAAKLVAEPGLQEILSDFDKAA